MNDEDLIVRVGSVPSAWHKRRIKDVFRDIFMGQSPVYDYEKDEGNVIIGQKNNQDYGLDLVELKHGTDRFYAERTSREFVQVGDVLLNTLGGGSVGRVGHINNGLPYPAITDGHLMILRGNICSRFCYYYLSSRRRDLELFASGSTNQCFFNVSDIRDIFLPYPSPLEQQRIVDYLDEKIAAIDVRVAVLEKKLSAYKRLKKSVINQAVTHGLDPNVKLKDSGVDWIGQVPEGWKVQRLKDVVKCNCDVLSEDTRPDFEFDYVDIGSVKYGQGIISCEHIVFADAPSRARRLVISNDIIVSTVRTYLKAVAKIHEFQVPLVVSTGFAVLRALKCYYQYLNYLVLSDRFVSVVEALSTGTGYPAISASNLINIIVAVPPLTEQKIIADYLDAECAKIDRTAEIVEKQIDVYKRLKRSLINEVVTGKRKVA